MGTSQFDLITLFAQWAHTGGMPKVVEEMEKTMTEPFPAEVRTTFLNNDPQAYSAANTYPWRALTNRLSAIDKPVLLIYGEKATELADMKITCSLIPHVEIKIIPKLDHAQAYWYGHEVVL